MYYSHKDVDVIQSVLNEELGNLQSWMNANRLSMNSSKTVCMLLETKFMLSKHDILNLEVNATKLNQVKCFKYLGVNEDCELKWNIHIEQLNKKIGKMIGFLRRLRYFINESNLKLIYTSVIMPHFDYADTVWANCKQ